MRLVPLGGQKQRERESDASMRANEQKGARAAKENENKRVRVPWTLAVYIIYIRETKERECNNLEIFKAFVGGLVPCQINLSGIHQNDKSRTRVDSVSSKNQTTIDILSASA